MDFWELQSEHTVQVFQIVIKFWCIGWLAVKRYEVKSHRKWNCNTTRNYVHFDAVNLMCDEINLSFNIHARNLWRSLSLFSHLNSNVLIYWLTHTCSLLYYYTQINPQIRFEISRLNCIPAIEQPSYINILAVTRNCCNCRAKFTTIDRIVH